MTARIATDRTRGSLQSMSPKALSSGRPAPPLDNIRIALPLRDCADLLAQQGEDGFRVRAYRAAAEQVERLDQPLREILRTGGPKALIALPAIGRGIGAAIAEMLATGHWAQLDRLKGETTPERLFRTLPGVGPVLADRFATLLDAQTLEELESALADPTMRMPGLGARRRASILAALQARLAPIRRLHPRSDAPHPPVALLLEVDALYRHEAAAGRLRQIAPRRFNPEGAAWLPVMHLRRGGWHLTVLFSNTARAHDLGRLRDWVVIFHQHGDGAEAQNTVVTETRGALEGKRVVRGREAECAAYYAEPGRAMSRQSSTSPGSAANSS